MEGITASIYDMAMGTSQMLGCLTERFLKIDPEAEITSYVRTGIEQPDLCHCQSR